MNRYKKIGDEKEELDAKIAKLSDFIGGPTWQTLNTFEQDRIDHQLDTMETYSKILGERIHAALGPK